MRTTADATTTNTTTRRLIMVTLRVTNEAGETELVERSIESGLTKVSAVKQELGVPETASLWVIEKSGKRKQLADHETHDVRAGESYEALVRGGVS
jgi:hypothetical protein